jgi:hypothetical protein
MTEYYFDMVRSLASAILVLQIVLQEALSITVANDSADAEVSRPQ